MTTPPDPDRLAEIVRDAVARLEEAGEPVTPGDVAMTARVSMEDVFPLILVWALEIAATDNLAGRAKAV